MITIILRPLGFEAWGVRGGAFVVVFKLPDQTGIFGSVFGFFGVSASKLTEPIPAAIVPPMNVLLLSRLLSLFCVWEVFSFFDLAFLSDIIVVLTENFLSIRSV